MRISKLAHTDTQPYISITLPEGFRQYQAELVQYLECTYNSTIDVDLGPTLRVEVSNTSKYLSRSLILSDIREWYADLTAYIAYQNRTRKNPITCPTL